ncbi:MAG: trypsin-like peptidase domain-containing protein [Acholeplasmatales bacterium]
MKFVKRIFKNFFISLAAVVLVLVTSLIVDFKIFNISLRDVSIFYSKQITTAISDAAIDIKRNPVIINLELTKQEENDVLVVYFKFVDEESLKSITINNNTYTNYTYQHDKDVFIAYFPLEIVYDENEIKKDLYVNSFLINDKTFISNKSITAFKGIYYEVIENVKKSVVKVVVEDNSRFSTKSEHGSGIIFRKELSSTKTPFGANLYNYYILTNYHVIQSRIKNDVFSGKISIRYSNINNEYPKYFFDRIEVVGWYIKDTDIAILKLTTTDANIKVLDDEQFITHNAVSVTEGQTVFLIGSPVTATETTFNEVKEGVIVKTYSFVKLKDDTNLCEDGCIAIKINAYLGQGSSGGGSFDSNGNLIGLHFAGNPDGGYSSEIPISIVLEAIEYIIGKPKSETYLKVSLFYIFFK